VTVLTLIALLVALWLLSGFYGYITARSQQLPEQRGLLASVAGGMLWLRKVLIWSAVRERIPAITADAETGRAAATAKKMTGPVIGTFVPKRNSAQTPAWEDAPVALPDPADEQDEQQAEHPQPRLTLRHRHDEQHHIGPYNVDELLPGQYDETAYDETPTAEEPAAADGDFEAVQEDAPAKPRKRSRRESKAKTPKPPKVKKPRGAKAPKKRKPRRLPGKPLFGTVKAWCDICDAKRKYGKDAACRTCGTVNEALVAKWGIEPAQHATIEEPRQLPAGYEDAHIIEETAEPAVTPPLTPAPIELPAIQLPPLTEDDLLIDPLPPVTPPAIAEVEPQPVVVEEEPAAVAEPAAEIPAVEIEEDAALATPSIPAPPPRPALKPRRAPRQPKPAKKAIEPAPWERGYNEDDDLIALDPDSTPDAYDKLPARPKVGTVKTVCLHCHRKTKHDREGTCKRCGNPNDYIRKRWGLIGLGALQLPKNAPPPKPAAPVEDVCPGCHRRARTDLNGDCIFCGTPIPEFDGDQS